MPDIIYNHQTRTGFFLIGCATVAAKFTTTLAWKASSAIKT
jgi:hypothetical protein